MAEPSKETPDYGNWVPMKFVYIPGFLSLLALAATFHFLPSLAAFVLFFSVFLYFLYARRIFSPRGGNVQDKILELVVSHLDWKGEGRALDIGCGNGALAIKLALQYPKAGIVGIDYWGARWDYSKAICEGNAKAEGVEDRLSFDKASASSLPFGDGSFDVVVSNLVFHEVADMKDKWEVIREALRVVKKGGLFVFQDFFLLKSMYGDPGELAATVRSWGIKKGRVRQDKRIAFHTDLAQVALHGGENRDYNGGEINGTTKVLHRSNRKGIERQGLLSTLPFNIGWG